MPIDWSMIGNLERPISEISHHALSHSETAGYKFTNAPTEERIRGEWDAIMHRGSDLHTHWEPPEDLDEHNGENPDLSYIMAPFFGSFIFITPVEKGSGDRTGTEMHSMICDDSEYLVYEALEKIGGTIGPMIPPISSVSLEAPNNIIEVESNSRMSGLSSWMFQLSEYRSVTGVAFGVPLKMLKKLFPHVSRWIIESISNSPENSDNSADVLDSDYWSEDDLPSDPTQWQDYDGDGYGDALRYMLDCSDPSYSYETLIDFRVLEEYSSEFEIDLQTLIPIHMYETHESAEEYWPKGEIFTLCNLTPKAIMKARMILGDREDAQKILIQNPELARQWMENARTDYPGGVTAENPSGMSFPFTKEETDHLISAMGSKRSFSLLYVCLGLMSNDYADDYSPESKIEMATILTRLGGQKGIGKIWKQVGPIGRKGIKSKMKDIHKWRENEQISDFWGLLHNLEGEATMSPNFRRTVAQEILSNSSKPEDIVGVIGYIPDIILTLKNHHKDWEILGHLTLSPKEIILTVNELQPSDTKMQQRLVLYLTRKGVPKQLKWRISSTSTNNGLIPMSHNHLVLDYKWMEPILAPIQTQTAYGAKMPEDAFYWMKSLTPSDYLTCYDNKELGVFMRKDHYARNFGPSPDFGWKKPRALRSDLVTVGLEEWKIYKIWAELLTKPSLADRFGYYKGALALIVGSLFSLAMAYCVLVTAPTVTHLEGSNQQGVLLAASSIILGLAIEKVRKHINEGMPNDLGFFLALWALFIMPLACFQMTDSLDVTFTWWGMIQFPEWIWLGSLGTHPIPDSITVGPFLAINPLANLFLVPMFWQIFRIMTDIHSVEAETRKTFYVSIRAAKRQKGGFGKRTRWT